MSTFLGIKRNGNISLAMQGEEILVIHNYTPTGEEGEYFCTHEVRFHNPQEAANNYHTAIATRDIRSTTRELEGILINQKQAQKKHPSL